MTRRFYGYRIEVRSPGETAYTALPERFDVRGGADDFVDLFLHAHPWHEARIVEVVRECRTDAPQQGELMAHSGHTWRFEPLE
jgi:hypothetical protein